MKTWKQILSDTSISDDFAISVNGETMTLGSMRAYDREHEGELTQRLTAREADFKKRETDINNASVGIATMLERISQATGLSTDELLAGKMPTKKEIAASGDLDENDPLVGKLVKELRSVREEVKAANANVENLKKNGLGPVVNTYLEDYYENQWDKLSGTLPEGSKVELKDALDYANKNGYKDSKSRLDLRKAIKDLTYEDRVKLEAKKLATEERKKMEDEFALRSAPRPSQLGQKVKPDKSLLNEKGRVKSLDEVLADAANDADMWKDINTSVQ